MLRAIVDVWREDLRYRALARQGAPQVHGRRPRRRGLPRPRSRSGSAGGSRTAPCRRRPPRSTTTPASTRSGRPGLFYAGFPVYLGLMNGEQMRRLADLAERFGGEHPPHPAAELHPQRHPRGARGRGGRARSGDSASRSTPAACAAPASPAPGDPFCNYTVAETKGRLQEIVEHLEATFGEEAAGLRLNLDGCPHACAQHWIGDIGLQGTTLRERGAAGRAAAGLRPLPARRPRPGRGDRPARPRRVPGDRGPPRHRGLFRAYLERAAGRRAHPALLRPPHRRGAASAIGGARRSSCPIEARQRRSTMMERRLAIALEVETRDLLDEFEAGQLAVELDDADAPGGPRLGARALGHAASPSAPASRPRAWPSSTWPGGSTPRCASSPSTPAACRRRPTTSWRRSAQRYGDRGRGLLPRRARRWRPWCAGTGPTSSSRRSPARLLCCDVRKVEPLRGVLEGLDAWITGLRRDQWASRANIRKVEIDHDHGGLVKVNPLADWTRRGGLGLHPGERRARAPALRQGLHQHRLRALHARRPRPGEDPRAGRWWWEKNAPKECGIHCPIETGGFEHEVEAILHRGAAPLRAVAVSAHGRSAGDLALDRDQRRGPARRAGARSPARCASPGAARPLRGAGRAPWTAARWRSSLLGRLERLLEMSLQTGRARQHPRGRERAGPAAPLPSDAARARRRGAPPRRSTRRCEALAGQTIEGAALHASRARASTGWGCAPTAAGSRWRSTATASTVESLEV